MLYALVNSDERVCTSVILGDTRRNEVEPGKRVCEVRIHNEVQIQCTFIRMSSANEVEKCGTVGRASDGALRPNGTKDPLRVSEAGTDFLNLRSAQF